MATIVVEFNDIEGESTVAGFERKVDALSMRDSIEVSAPQGSGRTRSVRTVGQAKHSDVVLARHKDMASPKLAQVCASGQNIGEVKVNLFRTLDTGVVVYMTYVLSDTFVSRIEHETLDENGGAFQPHIAPRDTDTGLNKLLVNDLNTTFAGGRRPEVMSAMNEASGNRLNLEIERLWLNAAKVRWTYTPYLNGVKQGAIEKAWDIQKGVAA